MKTKYSIREIIDRLVSVQSDTGTAMERNMAKAIIDFFKEDPYFQSHPDQCGLAAMHDFLDRSVVWALKKGKTSRTIVLTGHYDAVEIESYGDLKEYALKPDLLKAQIAKGKMGSEKIINDAHDDNWIFGRGTADMKGGMAVGIYETLMLSEESDMSVLFMAVCDEENLSAGARSGINVLLDIKEKFKLDYNSVLILEPQTPVEEGTFDIYDGSIGKIMPMVVVKGKLAHCGEPLRGINSASLIAEISSRIDLNTDLTTSDLNLTTQVPTIQFMRDLKEVYDVSMPEYSAAYVNMLFLGEENAAEIMKRIAEISKDAVSAVMTRYYAAVDKAMAQGIISEEDVIKKTPRVLSIDALETIVEDQYDDFSSLKNQILDEVRQSLQNGDITLQDAGVLYVKSLLRYCKSDEAMVVIGVCPPYYPPVHNEDSSLKTKMIQLMEKIIEEDNGLNLNVVPYFTGIGDGSYFSCVNPQGQRAFMKKMILPVSMYDIPFEASAQLNAPCIYMGARCVDYHQWSERVYLPDLEKIMPEIIETLIREL